MNVTDKKFVEFVRSSGEEWLLRLSPDEETSWSHVRERLNNAYAAHASLFPSQVAGEPTFDDDAVLSEAASNPHKVRALLQSIGASSPAMVAVIWRILNGDSILRIDLHYRQEEEFVLELETESAVSGQKTCVTTKEIEDATLLRHLGIMRVNQLPLFDGYYALRWQQAKQSEGLPQARGA